MIFLRATIDSFGKWIETSFDFTSNALNCFYGENESGKSTLQQFLLYMIFGLPPRKRKKFTPKYRKEIGGTLTIQHHKVGNVTIKRVEDQCECFLENGEIKNEAWWTTQLNGLTRELYTAIYAFSSTDLDDIRTMKKRDISDVLFSIGLSGSTLIYETEKHLLAKLQCLFKKQGYKPIMNQQLNEVMKISKQLQETQTEEQTYMSLLANKKKLEHSLDKLRRKLQKMREDRIYLEKKKQMIPQLESLRVNEQKLELLDENLPFPENGISRYQHWKDILLPKKSEHNLLKQKMTDYTEKYEHVMGQLLEQEELTQIETLVQTKPVVEQRKFQINQLEKELDKINEDLQQMTDDLMWEPKEMEQIALPFHLETEWKALVDRNHRLLQEERELNEKRNALAIKKDELVGEEKQWTNQTLPAEQLQCMEQKLAEEQKTKDKATEQEQFKNWQKDQLKKSKHLAYTFIVLAVISVMLDAIWKADLAWYSVPLIFLIAGGLHFFYTFQNVKAFDKLMNHRTANTILSEQERKKFISIMQKEKEVQNHLWGVKNELRQAAFLQKELDNQERQFTAKEIQFTEELDSIRFHYPFLKDIDVSHWVDYLTFLRQVLRLRKEKKKLIEEMEILHEENVKIYELLAAYSLESRFSDLENILKQQSLIQQSKEQFKQELDELQENSQHIEEEISSYEAEIDRLFHVANVQTEEHYYEVANKISEKEELQSENEAIMKQLYQLFPNDAVRVLLQLDLDKTTLEAEEQALRKQLRETEEQIASEQKGLATLEMQVKKLENQEEASTLRLRFQVEKERLNDQAKTWSVLKIALSTIEKAKQAYQEKYLLAVMDVTTDYFRHLTKDAYHKVHPPTEKQLFQVEGKNNIRYTVDELSQGTIDQLYIALRLAIAKVMSDIYNVPLLVDDAFVHFDDARTKQAIALIEQIARQQQVIFYTCKLAYLDFIDSNYLLRLDYELLDR